MFEILELELKIEKLEGEKIIDNKIIQNQNETIVNKDKILEADNRLIDLDNELIEAQALQIRAVGLMLLVAIGIIIYLLTS